jgi:hypothetical protein
MKLVDLVFGQRPKSYLDEPPPDAQWRTIRPKEVANSVRAWRAESDCAVDTTHGRLYAKGGQDFIVAHGKGDHSVVKPDIFERTYEPLGGGLYRKRTDLTLRYFTLKHPAVIRTLEGDQRARAGDWIVEGVTGELWPVPPDKAREKYEPA